jgi:hypothetical protein
MEVVLRSQCTTSPWAEAQLTSGPLEDLPPQEHHMANSTVEPRLLLKEDHMARRLDAPLRRVSHDRCERVRGRHLILANARLPDMRAQGNMLKVPRLVPALGLGPVLVLMDNRGTCTRSIRDKPFR